MIFVLIFAAASTLVHTAHSGHQKCPTNPKPSLVCKIEITKLKPTQICVGERAVLKKVAKIKKLSPKDFYAYYNKKAAPAIVGPGNKIYILDRHHTFRAFYHVGHKTGLVKILENFSHQSESTFWDHMKSRNWVYLFDQNGIGPLHPKKLPESILNLQDDPYRSLASFVEDAKGFKKKDIPFYDFYWAQKFRAANLLAGVDLSDQKKWNIATAKAVEFAKKQDHERTQ